MKRKENGFQKRKNENKKLGAESEIGELSSNSVLNYCVCFSTNVHRKRYKSISFSPSYVLNNRTD